jgi:hypothetical protein
MPPYKGEKMKPNLLKSRKFWIVVSDAIFSIAATLITFFLSQDTEVRVMVLGLLTILQPVVIALINAIATEDAAAMAAGLIKPQ